ncbi:hypothetical protein E4K73_49875 [Streptomyces sp. IB201691-2A2]|nr:hypothetical protein E4K73_49875 [Streptomyces sp. IB201691-2A2]
MPVLRPGSLPTEADKTSHPALSRQTAHLKTPQGPWSGQQGGIPAYRSKLRQCRQELGTRWRRPSFGRQPLLKLIFSATA